MHHCRESHDGARDFVSCYRYTMVMIRVKVRSMKPAVSIDIAATLATHHFVVPALLLEVVAGGTRSERDTARNNIIATRPCLRLPVRLSVLYHCNVELNAPSKY